MHTCIVYLVHCYMQYGIWIEMLLRGKYFAAVKSHPAVRWTKEAGDHGWRESWPWVHFAKPGRRNTRLLRSPLPHKQMKTDLHRNQDGQVQVLTWQYVIHKSTDCICSFPDSAQCRQEIRFSFRCFRKLKLKSVCPLFLTGLKSEGLYRVSGFTEHIEDVKMAFDRGRLARSWVPNDLSLASSLLEPDFTHNGNGFLELLRAVL